MIDYPTFCRMKQTQAAGRTAPQIAQELARKFHTEGEGRA